MQVGQPYYGGPSASEASSGMPLPSSRVKQAAPSNATTAPAVSSGLLPASRVQQAPRVSTGNGNGIQQRLSASAPAGTARQLSSSTSAPLTPAKAISRPTAAAKVISSQRTVAGPSDPQIKISVGTSSSKASPSAPSRVGSSSAAVTRAPVVRPVSPARRPISTRPATTQSASSASPNSFGMGSISKSPGLANGSSNSMDTGSFSKATVLSSSLPRKVGMGSATLAPKEAAVLSSGPPRTVGMGSATLAPAVSNGGPTLSKVGSGTREPLSKPISASSATSPSESNASQKLLGMGTVVSERAVTYEELQAQGRVTAAGSPPPITSAPRIQEKARRLAQPASISQPASLSLPAGPLSQPVPPSQPVTVSQTGPLSHTASPPIPLAKQVPAQMLAPSQISAVSMAAADGADPLTDRCRIYENICETIGQTPIVKVNALTPEGVNLYLKLEYFNPLSSVKDRLAIAIIDAGEKSGALQPGGTVIEATSGNTGIALAMVCAQRGYAFVAVMAGSFSVERRKVMRALGAKVVITPPALGGTGMVKKAEELAEKHGFFLARQFETDANAAYHYKTTGPEIVAAFKRKGIELDYWVTGYGTGGTFAGAGKAIKERSPGTKIILSEPKSAPLVTSGIKQERKTVMGVYGAPAAGHPAWKAHPIQGWTPNFIPKVCEQGLDSNIKDDVILVDAPDAIKTSLDLARYEGIFCGISGGATVWTALEVCKQAPTGSNVLAMVPDTAERYLSTPLFAGIEAEMDELETELLNSTETGADPSAYEYSVQAPSVEPSTASTKKEYVDVAEACRDISYDIHNEVEFYSFFLNCGDLQGMSVLDLACGEGRYSRMIKEQGALTVVGLDMSEEMLQLGQEHADAKLFQVYYIQHDLADRLPLNLLNSFDVVASQYLLCYAQTKSMLESMISNAFAALKPGGLFNCLTDNFENVPEEYMVWEAYGFHKRTDAQIGADGVLPEGSIVTWVFPGAFESDVTIWSKNTHEELFHKVGFVDVEWWGFAVPPQYADDEEIVKFLEARVCVPPVIGIKARKPS